jgi:gamma-glutamylcysteine synthetase
LTYRSDKRHKVQESRKSSKNVLKLASKLQRFVVTGKASKQDLRAIDENFRLGLIDQGKKTLQMLDQLREHIPKIRGKDSVEDAIGCWSNWIAHVESHSPLTGYCAINSSKMGFQNVLLEEAIDVDADLVRMMLAFNSSLAMVLRKCSYEVPDTKEIAQSVVEIMDAFGTREKLLNKLASSM